VACNENCLTCMGGDKKCTSCKIGFFLTDDGDCDDCVTFFTDVMVSF
jgi:hypothetical protein